MALSILDGNQSATTLSTILSSGQHITAHTVVSLGTQAITDIVNATSANLTNTQLRASAVTVGGTVTVGNSLTISSLPAISGTVTANVQAQQSDDNDPSIKFFPTGYAVRQEGGALDYYDIASSSTPLPVYIPAGYGPILGASTNRIGVVTIGAGTVTIGAGTAQIGSVTASLASGQSIYVTNPPSGLARLSVQLVDSAGTGNYGTDGSPLKVSGTVTIGAGTAQIGSVTASISGTVPISISSVTVGNSVTIGSLPAISGTVTASLSISSTAITSGSFTSLTSATLVPSNTARKMATVYNLGAGQLFVQAGATATTLGGGFMVALSSGDFYECDYTTTTLSAIFATAGTASWVSH